MAIHVSPLRSLQPTSLMAISVSPSSPRSKPSSPVIMSTCPLRTAMKKPVRSLSCGLIHKSNLFGSRNPNFPTLRRSCSNGYKGFSDEDMTEQIEELSKRLGLKSEEDETAEVAEMSNSSRFNRDLNFTREGFPISLSDPSVDFSDRRSPAEAAEEEEQMGVIEHCSAKKAFSSMVFMIRELQSYALHIRAHLTREDLQGIVTKVHREMNASFVWLFQQVFSQTPSLMVFVMILMANFTVHSMTRDAAAATAAQATVETVTESERLMGRRGRDGVVFPGGGKWELTEEEQKLWKSVVEEALLTQAQTAGFAPDHYTTVEIEKEDYEEFFRTDLLYQIGLSHEPNNPLLLANYAQFLSLVFKDHVRAEECFKRAIVAEPPDAEALSSYADFLWVVKKDLWEAEERYQQAMNVDPENSHHASKYAYFLWSTGAQGTCFPLHQQQQEDDHNHDDETT